MNAIKQAVEGVPNNGDLKDKIKTFDELFQTVREQIDETANAMNQQIKPEDINKVLDPLKNVTDSCQDIKSGVTTGMYATIAVFALFVLLFILALFNKCFSLCCGILGYFQMAIMLILLCMILPFLVGGGDFCLNARHFIDKEAPHNPILIYYLDCPKMNPLVAFQKALAKKESNTIEQILEDIDNYFKHAIAQLDDFDRNILTILNDDNLKCQSGGNNNQDIIKFCDSIKTLRADLGSNPAEQSDDSLRRKIVLLQADVKSITDEIDCKEITPKLYSTLTNVCTNIYLTLFYYAVSYALAFLALWMLVLFSSFLF